MNFNHPCRLLLHQKRRTVYKSDRAKITMLPYEQQLFLKSLAVEFGAFAVEFVGFAVEFVTL